MSTMKYRRFGIALVLSLATAAAARAAEPSREKGGLRAGDYVAVVGDSITEQKQYSVFIEGYLLMCKPAPDLRVSQFGWSGDTSWGFAGRMDNDLLRFKPAVATTCFGMNDGGYSPMNDDKARRYHDAQTDIVKQMKEAGVRFIVVGSPGAVDTDFFRRDPKDPSKAAEMSAMYNKTLASLRDIAKQVAQEQGVAFADVYGAMYDAMPKAKEKFGGKNYHVCGGDGFHPDANGHLLMAYAFLKGLGCDGNIGTITIDAAAKKAEASNGHKVLGDKDGGYEIESTKYPFCFYGDPKSPSATRGIMEVFPFNEELNRFKLVVKNPPGDRMTVTWGDVSKEFPAADLAKGINLAAEFADANPFKEPFKQVEGEIRKQQNAETPLVKTLIHNLRDYQKQAPEEGEALERVAAALIKKHRPAVEASAAAVKPVRHVIKIEARPAQAAKSSANAPTMKPNAGTPDNTPPAGFTAAFNGKDLTGWKGLMKSPLDNPYNRAKLSPEAAEKAQAEADEDMRAHWKAEDGALVFDGKGRSLVMAKDYGDFEMWVDWKIKEKGDSGIYVRGTPQIQIWDVEGAAQNAVGSGGLFNNKNNPSKPLKKADKPVGEWNTFFIRMVGDKVTVYLNGELVVDNTPLENYWSRQSKLGDLPLFPTGQIELQNHGNTLWFKNIYVRELPAGPDKSASPAKT